MEEYALERITAILEGNSITYHVTDDNGSFSDEAVTDTVDDARVKALDCWGTLEGLAPDGTLEVWEFSCEVKPTNAPGREILTAGGGYVTEDGYWCEGLTDLLVVLRRSDNGQYEILQKETSPEHTDFFGYHNTIEEAIYDWYVTENSLDLPLYVEDWIDEITYPEGASRGNFPVHRYDGGRLVPLYPRVNLGTGPDGGPGHPVAVGLPPTAPAPRCWWNSWTPLWKISRTPWRARVSFRRTGRRGPIPM